MHFKDKDGNWRSMRGTSQIESYHARKNISVSGLRCSPDLVNALLTFYNHRFNINAAVQANLQPHFVHKDLALIDSINLLCQQLGLPAEYQHNGVAYRLPEDVPSGEVFGFYPNGTDERQVRATLQEMLERDENVLVEENEQDSDSDSDSDDSSYGVDTDPDNYDIGAEGDDGENFDDDEDEDNTVDNQSDEDGYGGTATGPAPTQVIAKRTRRANARSQMAAIQNLPKPCLPFQLPEESALLLRLISEQPNASYDRLAAHFNAAVSLDTSTTGIDIWY
jgi:hypothetical protein